ncbi:CLIP domain-containing serine protease 14D-like [Pieris napi]|uniref:CLIP domain-containing serine protease 14D-like n=1 Tax=Pieris napi TaxID=78633 RepID=UPI001FB88BA7|nr:CLIP domain-containing serine protease 14D-like [Pieris napi]
MIKSLLLITLVLQMCSTQILEVCNSCMFISQCKAATDLYYKRDYKSQKLLQEAYCGCQQYNGRVYLKVCCSDILPLEKRKENLLPNVCGSISGNRIIGGKKANLGEFPWMAVIRYKDSNRMCAGSVINSKYILTAAHCVFKFPIDYVIVGEYNLYEDPDCEYLPGNIVNCRPNIEMKVAKVIIHEQYESQSKPSKNDIALLRLDGVIDFQKSGVEPICLPVSSELRNKKLALKTGIVTGWGYTEDNEPSEVLLKVKVPVNRKCYAVNSLCAGKKNKDSCIGDSGGPLMMTDFYNNVSSYIQYGIVSYGPKKCGSSKGAVYVDVKQYVKWILDNLRE